MRFQDLPRDIRVKLEEKDDEELWHRIDEFGGVKTFSEAFDVSSSRLYNWRHHQEYYPVGFVKRLMGANPPGIEAIKGRGRSRAVTGVKFPLPENPELLTRVEESVVVNSRGIPVYQTREPSLAERFHELLLELGEVPVNEYRRDRYELRYPKFLHSIFEKMSYNEDFAALVDETGGVEDGELKASGKTVPVEEFEGELHSREKKMSLALERNDSEEVERLMKEEMRKVREAFG